MCAYFVSGAFSILKKKVRETETKTSTVILSKQPTLCNNNCYGSKKFT